MCGVSLEQALFVLVVVLIVCALVWLWGHRPRRG